MFRPLLRVLRLRTYTEFTGMTVRIDSRTFAIETIDPETRVTETYFRPISDLRVPVLDRFVSDEYVIRETARMFQEAGANVIGEVAEYPTVPRVVSVLEIWSALLPARVVKEDLGDYLEDIHRRCAAGQRWCVYLRVIAAIFWTSLNAIGYAMKALGKKRAG